MWDSDPPKESDNFGNNQRPRRSDNFRNNDNRPRRSNGCSNNYGRNESWKNDGQSDPWNTGGQSESWGGGGQSESSKIDGQSDPWNTGGQSESWGGGGQSESSKIDEQGDPWSTGGQSKSSGGGVKKDTWSDGGQSDSWNTGGQSDSWNTGGQSKSSGGGVKKDTWSDGGQSDSWNTGGQSDSWNTGGQSKSSGRGGQNESWNNDGPQKTNEDGEEKAPRPPAYRPQDIDFEEEAKLHADGVGENFKRYKEQHVNCLPLGAVEPIEKFEELIESPLLLKNVASKNFTEMTPIQKWAIPAITKGFDIISCAQTGSGKTAAFLLPILQNLLKTGLEPQDPNEDCRNPYCLILLPTRELTKQIYTEAMFLTRDSVIRVCYLYGQVSTHHLKAQLSRGCHVLVSTLGRLKDFVERRWIAFKNIKYVVLDEGDRLIDDGFRGDIATIFEHETMPPKDKRQTLFFSATFKKDMQAQARQYLNAEHFVFLAVGKIGASNEDIKQEFLQVARDKKKQELKRILAELSETDKAIIFTQTKQAADLLAGFFNALKLPAVSIHGDREQHQREQAITVFKKGERRFLISSPVGNRGLDLPKVSLVINYDLPKDIDEYVHRIGRTGRAGHTGRAISFVDLERDREMLPDLIKNLKDAKQEIPDWLSEDGARPQGGEWANADDDWAGSSNQPSTSAKTNDNWSNADDGWNGTANNHLSTGTTASSNLNVTGAASNDWGEDDWGNNAKPASGPAPSVRAADDDWGSVTKVAFSNDRPASTTRTVSSSNRNIQTSDNDDDWGTTSVAAAASARNESDTSHGDEDPNDVSTGLKRPAEDDEPTNPTKRVDYRSTAEYEEW